MSVSAFGVLIDLFLPTRCHHCREFLRGETNPFFCRACWESIALLDGPCCPRCGKPYASEAALSHSPNHRCGDCRKRPPAFERAAAAGRYEGILMGAIRRFKYRGGTRLAGPLASVAWKGLGRLPVSDCLVPVPLHPARLREREFNQALLLCDELSKRGGLPVVPDALERIRPTAPQIGLSLKERRRNVRRAFAARRPDRIEGRRVILVDDVYTTGVTLNECARVLRRAGARAVSVLTVARTDQRVG